MSNSKLILFDGVCNLCNGFVQFVIKNDKQKLFKFGSLQSENSKSILLNLGVEQNLKTVILIDDGVAYFKSDAALKIMKQLQFPFKILYIFIIVPRFIRNWVYDFIAKYRYKFFGKKDTCMVPKQELKERFID
jgi:predicted DCC family thiol-disulfide oxidoreductase YuxK